MTHEQHLEPLHQYIRTVSGEFKKQSIRLRDPTILSASRELLSLYFKTLSQFGSREHDLGVYTLEQQIEQSKKYAAKSRRGIFRQLVAPSHQTGTDEPKEARQAIASINDLLDLEDLEPEARSLLLDIRTSISAMEKSESEMDALDAAIRSSLLDFGIKMHISTYSKLVLWRIFGFCGRHLFILSVSVAGMSIGYSWLVGHGELLLRATVASHGFLVACFIFTTAILKEYVFSKQVKKLRARFERWLLFPVAHHVFRANVQGLYRETADRAA